MSVDELSNKYMDLRSELERAYGEPVWDSGRLDSLAAEISDTELALVASGGPEGMITALAAPAAGTTVA